MVIGQKNSQLCIVLSGAHPAHGGGVAAFCDMLAPELSQLGFKIIRNFSGAGYGERPIKGAMVKGAKVFLATLPKMMTSINSQSILHINPSFKRKALLRDALYFILARARGARIIVHFHGGLPSDVTDFSSRWALSILSKADAVIVINRFQFQQLGTLFPKISHRIFLIPIGIVLPKTDIDKLVEQRLAHFRLFFMGRLIEGKGLLETLRAIAVLRDQGTCIPLTVAGVGNLMDEARQLADDLKLSKLVSFLGHVEGAEKDRRLREATVLLFPSSLTEGMPLVILEAFAYGIPVVASSVPSVAELVKHGTHGFLTKSSDPLSIAEGIRSVTDDQDVYQMMSRLNRIRAEANFDVRNIATRISQIYMHTCKPDVPEHT